MKNLTETIFGFLSRKPTIYFVIGFWILTNALMFPLLMKLRTLSGTMIPDVIPRHNAHVLTNIFTAYGTDGMTVYGKVAFYDIFYPIGYALFFGLLIYLLFKKSKLKYLAWMPILAAIFDHIENYYLGKIVANLPTIDPGRQLLQEILS